MDYNEVLGGEVSHPEQAIILGAVKTISQELPNLSCQHIDVNRLDFSESFMAKLFSKSNELTMAYRGNFLWKQRFDPISPKKESTLSIRTHGAYLITGGLGGIGLSLAHWMAQQKPIQLILTSRSIFPPKTDWKHLLSLENTPINLKENPF